MSTPLPGSDVMPLSRLREAHERIKPYIKNTELRQWESPRARLISPQGVYLKCDNFQVTNSFKVRGAFNFILGLSREERRRGLVTRSSGNFAQALAYAGRKLRLPAGAVTVVMPENAPPIKVYLTESHGARVILYGLTSAESDRKVEEIQRREGRTRAYPFDHPDVIAGQGSAALEIFEALPEIGTFFCPVSGGGLLAGCAAALKQLNPAIRVIGVEPEGADDYYRSFYGGERVSLSTTNTIADGLRTLSVGTYNWPLLKRGGCVDDVVLVSDHDIRQAMAAIFYETGMKVEPSGAVSVAGLLKYPKAGLKGPVVCMLSGGNIEEEYHRQLISEGAAAP